MNRFKIEIGAEFYYADRNKKEPVKCKILDIHLGYPLKIIAQREDTGDIFRYKTSGGIYSCYYHAVTIAWEYIGSLTLTSFLEYYNCYGGAAWEERAS